MLRVVLVDDQNIFREMLGQILVAKLGVKILAEFATAESALAELRNLSPDILVLDVTLPDGSGLDVVAKLKSQMPRMRVLVLTASDRLDVIQQATRLGVHGIVMKGVSLAELELAVQAVGQGRTYYCSTSLKLVRQSLQTPSREELTSREKQVAMMIARGKSSKAIAAELRLSVKTIANHRLHVMKKMGANNAADVTRQAAERGWLT